jgi:exopolysaccharide production protein ExoZ
MNWNVQYLRASAAVMVLLHHASLRIEGFYGVDLLAGRGNILAFVGVNLFFCISGYLMTILVGRTSAGHFLWHRIARLYPAFFVAVVVAIALNLIFGGPIPQYDWWSLTLLPLQRYGPLQVEWTLNYEIVFYLISAVFCISVVRRLHKPMLLVWVALIFVSVTFFGNFATSQFPVFYELPLSSWTASFVAGGLVSYAGRLPMIRRYACQIGFAGLIATAILLLFPDFHSLLPPYSAAIPLSCVVLGAFDLETIFRASWLRRMGDASYAIYLIHQTACAWLIGLLAPHVPSPYVMFGILLLVSTRSGLILGALDLWMYGRLKNLWSAPLDRQRVPQPHNDRGGDIETRHLAQETAGTAGSNS